MISSVEQSSANSPVRDLRDSINRLVPIWLPSRVTIVSAVVLSAVGYVLIAVVAIITSPSTAHPVMYALAPISLATIALKGISARRLRGVVTALDSPHFADLKAELVKRTQGLHQSTAAGISILLTLATVLLLGTTFMSIVVGSFALTALAQLCGVTCLISSYLLYLRSFVQLRLWLDGVACARCGYDLRATPDRCPECGTPTPASIKA